jgi:hypothetical protein
MKLYLLYTLLNLADVGLTYIGMKYHGYGEANVIVANAIHAWGYLGMFWLALVAQWGVAYFARRFGRVSAVPVLIHATTVAMWVGLLTGVSTLAF